MITIIHGDDISESRKHFQDLKLKHKNFVLLDGGKITITDLVQNIEGSGIFGNTNFIFTEDLLVKLKRKGSSTKEILNFIDKNSRESFFVLWESKEISKRDLSVFKNAVIKNYKLPKNIFLFLDNLKPNNPKNLLRLFHQALDSGIKEELILFMISRQIRLLLVLCHPEQNYNDNIDEIVRLNSWQMEKLERQAKLFTESELKQLYKKLYEIEIGQKTGTLSLSLVQAIDFFLLEI